MIMGEALHVWRQEAYGKFLYLPLNYAVILKSIKKKTPKNKEGISALSALILR